ncbi:MAG: hypothetical protein K8S23_14955 [Candidatus Cloacimonetes bacterium]|nr:hypothetical protein [Candidatus Cloacimonadota bacterium]
MKAYKLERTLSKNGVLSLQGLPFHSGEKVEIIILKCDEKSKKISLKNRVIEYDKPFESVAQDNWNILK